MKRWLLAMMVLLPCCVQPAGDGNGPPAGTVYALESRFQPASIGVAIGEVVTWKVVSENHHTVTIADPAGGAAIEDSGDLSPRGSFRYAFDAAGTYDVYCRYHSQGAQGVFLANEMVMTVVAR